MSANEYNLTNPPTDGITRVAFKPVSGSPLLIASSWDRGLRLYDVKANQLKGSFQHKGAVLDACFLDQVRVASGGLDRVLKLYDFETKQESPVGSHDSAIRCVVYSPELDLIVTGSWDKSIKLWDIRQKSCIGTYDQNNEAVYAMSMCGERVVVGTANRKVIVWNLRNMQFAEQRRLSSLKYQTRVIECFPNQQGYVLGSIEGRVAVEFMEPDQEVQKKKYAFKCHRIKGEDGTERIYPVMGVSFHTTHNTFATGGRDGFVNVWDPFNKKRLCQFHRFSNEVSALSFNHDGDMMAVAVSEVLPEEAQENSPPAIIIRSISEAECAPKT